MTALSCNGLRFVRRLSAYLQLSHVLCGAHCCHCDVCIVSLLGIVHLGIVRLGIVHLGIVHLGIVRLGIHCDLTEDYLLSRLFLCLTLLLFNTLPVEISQEINVNISPYVCLDTDVRI